MATRTPHPPESAPPDAAAPDCLDYENRPISAFLNVRGGYRIPPHFHPHFELLYILKGARGLRLNGIRRTAESGDLVVFRPGEVHEEFSASETISYFVFRFHPSQLQSAHLEFPPTDRTGPVITIPRRERFLELFSRMMDEHENRKPGSGLLLGAYMVEFVVLLRRAVDEVLQSRPDDEEDRRQNPRLRAAMETIQQNLAGELNLKKLAQSVFMSVSHFAHTFKQHVGESPKSFLIRERIEKAKELLATSGKTAREIAAILGYDSPYYFYRQFRRRTGMTTAEFRRRHPPPSAAS